MANFDLQSTIEEPALEDDDDPLDVVNRSRSRQRRSSKLMQQKYQSLPVSRALSLPPPNNNVSSAPNKPNSRHYKKDSRFVLDLYTLTFDEDETVEDVETCKLTSIMEHNNPITESELLSFSSMNSSSGPISLGSNVGESSPEKQRQSSLPSLETNLHKILARKIADSEEVSFRKAKLLTKAYYKLLRESATPIIDPQVQVIRKRREEEEFTLKIGQGRLSWQMLLSKDNAELKRTVGGLSNTVKALNDFLMDMLVERDSLLMKQDEMLEQISELTDNLL